MFLPDGPTDLQIRSARASKGSEPTDVRFKSTGELTTVCRPLTERGVVRTTNVALNIGGSLMRVQNG